MSEPARVASHQAPPPPEAVGSIAIIRALALGDLLCAVPTFRAIRRRFPNANVTLIGLPWSRELIPRFPEYLDEHLEFPGFPGIPEVPVDPGQTTTFLAEMQRRRFDLAIQLHGSGHWINAFVGMLGARWTAGFVPTRIDDPGITTPGTWIPYPDRGSEITRLLELARALGALVDERLEFPLRDADGAAAAALLASEGTGRGPYTVIHAGSSTPARRWPPSSFAEIGQRLADAGLRIVLTGTAAERDLASEVARGLATPPTDLAGRTDLGALAGVMAGSRLVVTNDTGVSHLAAALEVASVIVFSGSDVDRWAPLDRKRHTVVRPRPDGSAASVDAVWAAVQTHLQVTLAAVAGSKAGLDQEVAIPLARSERSAVDPEGPELTR